MAWHFLPVGFSFRSVQIFLILSACSLVCSRCARKPFFSSGLVAALAILGRGLDQLRLGAVKIFELVDEYFFEGGDFGHASLRQS